MKRRLVALGLCFFVPLAGVAAWVWVPPDMPTAGCTFERNAAWISADWTAEPVDEAAVQQLAEDAGRRQLEYLLPFVTYRQADGSFSPSYGYAGEFVSQFRRFNKDTALLAWMGMPLRKHGRFGVDGWVDLADQRTRLEIATFAADLVENAGFDGVHLDVETVRDGNPYYLLLLEEVRAALPEERLLSVASGYWMPRVINSLPIVGGYKWSGNYYQQVAVRVDQIAAMTYDSLMPHPALYRAWMREQVKGISRSLKNMRVELLIGISVSRERTVSHHPDVETLAAGLAGICTALKGGSRVDGLAVYAAWAATDADWAVWDRWRGASDPIR